MGTGQVAVRTTKKRGAQEGGGNNRKRRRGENSERKKKKTPWGVVCKGQDEENHITFKKIPTVWGPIKEQETKETEE